MKQNYRMPAQHEHRQLVPNKEDFGDTLFFSLSFILRFLLQGIHNQIGFEFVTRAHLEFAEICMSFFVETLQSEQQEIEKMGIILRYCILLLIDQLPVLIEK